MGWPDIFVRWGVLAVMPIVWWVLFHRHSTRAIHDAQPDGAPGPFTEPPTHGLPASAHIPLLAHPALIAVNQTVPFDDIYPFDADPVQIPGDLLTATIMHLVNQGYVTITPSTNPADPLIAPAPRLDLNQIAHLDALALRSLLGDPDGPALTSGNTPTALPGAWAEQPARADQPTPSARATRHPGALVSALTTFNPWAEPVPVSVLAERARNGEGLPASMTDFTKPAIDYWKHTALTSVAAARNSTRLRIGAAVIALVSIVVFLQLGAAMLGQGNKGFLILLVAAVPMLLSFFMIFSAFGFYLAKRVTCSALGRQVRQNIAGLDAWLDAGPVALRTPGAPVTATEWAELFPYATWMRRGETLAELMLLANPALAEADEVRPHLLLLGYQHTTPWCARHDAGSPANPAPPYRRLAEPADRLLTPGFITALNELAPWQQTDMLRTTLAQGRTTPRPPNFAEMVPVLDAAATPEMELSERLANHPLYRT